MDGGKTAFITHWGSDHFKVVLLWLCKALATFKRMMGPRFQGTKWVTWVCCLDLLAFSNDFLLYRRFSVRLCPTKYHEVSTAARSPIRAIPQRYNQTLVKLTLPRTLLLPSQWGVPGGLAALSASKQFAVVCSPSTRTREMFLLFGALPMQLCFGAHHIAGIATNFSLFGASAQTLHLHLSKQIGAFLAEQRVIDIHHYLYQLN